MTILPPTYFGPVSWYRKLACAGDGVCIDTLSRYVKQTTRNHCVIATANGTQKLTVPVSYATEGGGVLVSDHGNWRHQHWEALCSAYGMSPFFEYYADDIKPFFEDRWEKLYDFDLATTSKMCDLIGIDIALTPPEQCERKSLKLAAAVTPDASSDCPPYYQTFQRRHGFLPDLSILDLLFNLGPESLRYLYK